jgi:hypothetical protein
MLLLPPSEDSANEGTPDPQKSFRLIWKHETIQALQRLLRNTGSFCDPHRESGDDDDSYSMEPKPTSNQTLTRRDVKAAATTNCIHPHDLLECSLSGGGLVLGDDVVFRVDEEVRNEREAKDCGLQIQLSNSTLTDADGVLEAQGHTPIGAPTSPKMVLEDAYFPEKQRSGFFLNVFSLRFFCILALLMGPVTHPGCDYGRTRIMKLNDRLQHQLWQCEMYRQGLSGTECVLESMISYSFVHARACRAFLTEQQQDTACFIEPIIRLIQSVELWRPLQYHCMTKQFNAKLQRYFLDKSGEMSRRWLVPGQQITEFILEQTNYAAFGDDSSNTEAQPDEHEESKCRLSEAYFVGHTWEVVEQQTFPHSDPANIMDHDEASFADATNVEPVLDFPPVPQMVGLGDNRLLFTVLKLDAAVDAVKMQDHCSEHFPDNASFEGSNDSQPTPAVMHAPRQCFTDRCRAHQKIVQIAQSQADSVKVPKHP